MCYRINSVQGRKVCQQKQAEKQSKLLFSCFSLCLRDFSNTTISVFPLFMHGPFPIWPIPSFSSWSSSGEINPTKDHTKGIRRKLVIIAVLLFFWLFIRFIKYNVFSRKDTISRYLWYMYYIPQCLVPPISLIAMMELTRKKKENLSKLIYLILIPAFVLILLILTNDFHQLAFAFKATEENSVVEYTHRIIFYLAIAWIIIMTFLSLVTLILKCSISICKRKIWIPLLVFLITTIACTLCFIFATQSYKIPELSMSLT